MKKILILTSVAVFLSIPLIAAPFFLNPEKVHSATDMTKSKIKYSLRANRASAGINNNPPSDTFHLRSVSPDMPLKDVIKKGSFRDTKLFNIYVDAASRTLSIKYGEKTLKEYRVGLGTKTKDGDKEREGDYRTPKGEFYICSKAVYTPTKKYLGSRWMLLSYPGLEAADRGLKSNLIDKATCDKITKAISKSKVPPQDTLLGSAIGIHGGAEAQYPKDWTAGCVGMYDQDVEEIFEYVSVGTKVVIR